jgi:hypothetical protein
MWYADGVAAAAAALVKVKRASCNVMVRPMDFLGLAESPVWSAAM